MNRRTILIVLIALLLKGGVYAAALGNGLGRSDTIWMSFALETNKHKNRALGSTVRVEFDKLNNEYFSLYLFLIDAIDNDLVNAALISPNDPSRKTNRSEINSMLSRGTPDDAQWVEGVSMSEIIDNPDVKSTGKYTNDGSLMYYNKDLETTYFEEGSFVYSYTSSFSGVANFEIEGQYVISSDDFIPKRITVVDYNATKNTRKKIVTFNYHEFTQLLHDFKVRPEIKGRLIATRFNQIAHEFELDPVYDPFDVNQFPIREREELKNNPLKYYIELEKIWIKLRGKFEFYDFDQTPKQLNDAIVQRQYEERLNEIKHIRTVVAVYPEPDSSQILSRPDSAVSEYFDKLRKKQYSQYNALERSLTITSKQIQHILNVSKLHVYGDFKKVKLSKIFISELNQYRKNTLYIFPSSDMVLLDTTFVDLFNKRLYPDVNLFTKGIDYFTDTITHDSYAIQTIGSSVITVACSNRGLSLLASFIDERYNPATLTEFQHPKEKIISWVQKIDQAVLSSALIDSTTSSLNENCNLVCLGRNPNADPNEHMADSLGFVKSILTQLNTATLRKALRKALTKNTSIEVNTTDTVHLRLVLTDIVNNMLTDTVAFYMTKIFGELYYWGNQGARPLLAKQLIANHMNNRFLKLVNNPYDTEANMLIPIIANEIIEREVQMLKLNSTQLSSTQQNINTSEKTDTQGSKSIKDRFPLRNIQTFVKSKFPAPYIKSISHKAVFKNVRLIGIATETNPSSGEFKTPFESKEKNEITALLLSRRTENGVILDDSENADLLQENLTASIGLSSLVRNYGKYGIKTYIRINPHTPELLAFGINTSSIDMPEVQAFWIEKIEKFHNKYNSYFGGFVIDSETLKTSEDTIPENWLDLGKFIANYFMDNHPEYDLIWKISILHNEVKAYRKLNDLVTLPNFRLELQNPVYTAEAAKIINPDFITFYATKIRYNNIEWSLFLYNDLISRDTELE